jgi:hypothetical protein
MLNFNEDFLQFAWQHRLLKPQPLTTSSGKEIVILKQGELNKDSGPDFFNARIKINDIILAGNIEVHVKTSDWLRHKHQNDKAYDNIILHVVYENDIVLTQNTENNVEVLEIKHLVPSNILNEYESILASKQAVACSNQLASVNDLKFSAWMERMVVERLEHRVKNIELLFENSKNDYIQTFYTVLLRNFGFKVNSVPFELLARQLPITLLLKHSDNLMQLEALLLGTSGLLDQQFEDKYILDLQNEFEFLKNKYLIIPLKKALFKFSKLRPANFATIRLAQFAKLIHLSPHLFSAPLHYDSYDKIKNCFKIVLNGYWQNHYNLGGESVKKNLQLGYASISNIVTNTFACFFFFCFKRTGKIEYQAVPFKLMEKCAFEKNAKTRLYEQKKQLLITAAESQALINLHDNYCVKRKCLNCGIAAAILKSA